MYLISSPLLWRAPIVVSASRAVLASAPETYFALLVLKTILYGILTTLFLRTMLVEQELGTVSAMMVALWSHRFCIVRRTLPTRKMHRSSRYNACGSLQI
jgi:hypothetical protein